MKVPDEVRKTVGFVAYENKTTHELIPVGSMFFLGHDPKDGGTLSEKVYAVTARHVVDGLRQKGCTELVIRLNLKDKARQPDAVAVPVGAWFTHPTDSSIDVAICQMGVPQEADHLVIPFSMCVTKKTFVDHEVELGEEVFISGLFRHHFGAKRNIPIVRVGNLAALNEERIVTKAYGEIDAYLIEARSIGGLSGSPVFLNLGIVRKVGGEVKHATGRGSIIYLLGLIHGHFDAKQNLSDANEAINSGIAIVVPIEGVMAVINAYEERNLALA